MDNRKPEAEKQEKGGGIIVEEEDSILDIVTNPASTLQIFRNAFSSPAALARSLCPFIIIDTNKPQVLKRIDKK